MTSNVSRSPSAGNSEERAERWVSGILEKKLRGQRRRARKTLRPLAEKKRRGERLTKGDVGRGMEVLCFKHLAFCCGAEKKCGYRDSLLEALGLGKAEYIEYKRRCERLLWRVLRENSVIG